MSGRARVGAGGQEFGTIGGRANVSDGSPGSFYAPAHSSWRAVAEGACEIAMWRAPGIGALPRATGRATRPTSTSGPFDQLNFDDTVFIK